MYLYSNKKPTVARRFSINLSILDKLLKCSDLDAGAKDLRRLLDLIKLGERGSDSEVAVLGIAAVGVS